MNVAPPPLGVPHQTYHNKISSHRTITHAFKTPSAPPRTESGEVVGAPARRTNFWTWPPTAGSPGASVGPVAEERGKVARGRRRDGVAEAIAGSSNNADGGGASCRPSGTLRGVTLGRC